jgi:DNA-binding NarL/FixJ family response regulator
VRQRDQSADQVRAAPRHPHVGHDECRAVRTGGRHRAVAVDRLTDHAEVALLLQQRGNGRSHVRIVVRDDDGDLTAGRGRHGGTFPYLGPVVVTPAHRPASARALAGSLLAGRSRPPSTGTGACETRTVIRPDPPDGPAPATVRVLVVDDHQMFATSLAHALQSEPDLVVVGQATSIGEAQRLIASTAPDVVLLDHRLPDGDGVGAIADLRAIRPSARIVVLTATASDRVLVAAMEAGAAGFIAKTQRLDDVTAGVRAAAQGESVVSAKLLSRLLPRLHRQSGGPADLTEREREILDLLARGLSNADIARELTISVHTVRNHVANLSAKLGAHSKLEVLAIAVRRGLVDGG